MSFMLLGNYGAGNIGDEALKNFFLTEFREVSWNIVSASPSSPAELPRLPAGVRSFFLTSWWKTVRAIARSRGIVYGGGTLFSDVESLSACCMWASYACIAVLFRKPIFLAFQGVGPFRTKLGERIASFVYQHAVWISMRDELSLHRVKAWKTRTKPVLTFDPAFSYFAKHVRVEGARKALVLVPRTNSTESFFKAVRERFHAEHWDVVRIVLMQPSNEERMVAQRLQSVVLKADIIEPNTVDAFLTEICRATFVVTQRYHGALAALAMAIPVHIIPLKHGDKLDALKEFVQTPEHLQDLLASIRASIDSLRRTLEGTHS